MSESDLITQYALSFVGVPYVYGGTFGGRNTLVSTGFDCSGFTSEILRSAGLIRYFEELNSQEQFDRFKDRGIPDNKVELLRDDGHIVLELLFFGLSDKEIDHVAIGLDKHSMIEAGGGDHTTTFVELAAKRNAMVRIRPRLMRKDFLGSLFISNQT